MELHRDDDGSGTVLRAGDPIIVASYDPEWPQLFHQQAMRLRAALGDVALRIDHIGSTAIPGLPAKPIIDIQVSVATFEPLDAFRLPLEAIGYVFRAGNLERTKRYFREAPGTHRTHVHVRQYGHWSEQFALLFRDYLRGHPEVAVRYAVLKRNLIHCYAQEGQIYTEAKTPFIWATMRDGDAWAQAIGWTAGATDA